MGGTIMSITCDEPPEISVLWDDDTSGGRNWVTVKRQELDGCTFSDDKDENGCIDKAPDDNCATFDKLKCLSKWGGRKNGCNYDRGTETCEIKDDWNGIQPEPLELCVGPCCDLNKRACKGKGKQAKLFKKDNNGKSPKRLCRFKKDFTM